MKIENLFNIMDYPKINYSIARNLNGDFVILVKNKSFFRKKNYKIALDPISKKEISFNSYLAAEGFILSKIKEYNDYLIVQEKNSCYEINNTGLFVCPTLSNKFCIGYKPTFSKKIVPYKDFYGNMYLSNSAIELELEIPYISRGL
ncbi:MAG: hypothetical protein K2X69_10190 [Silvanigrellaceae bacterium]|nr:hypothetical protein [Silvanigrellaceae bacterium]